MASIRRACALALCALLALLAGAARPAGAAASTADFSANVRVNHVTTDQQQEPSIAINPTNPQFIIAAAKDWRESVKPEDRKEVWHYHSSDGGKTWADVHLPGLPADLPNQSDPVVVYNADGVAYTSVIGYNQADLTKGGLFVAHSTDNGATWSVPVQVAQNSTRLFNDKEWLTVDRSNTPTRGTLYLAWTLFTKLSANTERGDIVEVRSTDGGLTWSAPVQVSDRQQQNDVQGAYPIVGPRGDLNILYFDQTAVQALWMGRSVDGGKSFAAPVKVANAHRPPSPLPSSKFRMFVLPWLAVNPQDDALVAVWNDFTTTNTDVLLAASHDGGHTWSAPVRVNGDTGTADQFFPTAVFGPDGVLHLAWLDRRDDPRNLTFACYYSQSFDEGATFTPNVRLADAQSDPSVGFGGTLIGDYIQVDAVAGEAWVAWVDTRTGDQNIEAAGVTGRLMTAPVPAATAPPAPPAPAATATPAPVAAAGFADPAFARVWARTDKPVQTGQAARPWIWGPAPFAAGNEAYAQGPNGHRLVQYFDKSRMEINNPAADPAGPWYVTNGLLVVEMMTGQVQIGDTTFDSTTYRPNPAAVAGDVDSPNAPTYASLAHVASLHGDNRQADATGALVSGIVDATGAVTPGAPSIPAAAQVQYVRYDPKLGHNIPNVFVRFLDQQGPVVQNGQIVQGAVVDPLFAFGYPITEAYWAQVRIGGQPRWVLIQAFQRRVLTYVPDNAPAWQVEMGNVGRHYYDWRYGPHSPLAVQRGDTDER